MILSDHDLIILYTALGIPEPPADPLLAMEVVDLMNRIQEEWMSRVKAHNE